MCQFTGIPRTLFKVSFALQNCSQCRPCYTQEAYIHQPNTKDYKFLCSRPEPGSFGKNLIVSFMYGLVTMLSYLINRKSEMTIQIWLNLPRSNQITNSCTHAPQPGSFGTYLCLHSLITMLYLLIQIHYLKLFGCELNIYMYIHIYDT